MIYEHRPAYPLDTLCSICGKPFSGRAHRELGRSDETCSGNCQYIAQRTIPGFGSNTEVK